MRRLEIPILIAPAKKTLISAYESPMDKMHMEIKIFCVSLLRMLWYCPLSLKPGLKLPPAWYPKASGMRTAAMMMDTVSVPLPTKGIVWRIARSSDERTTYPSRMMTRKRAKTGRVLFMM